MHHSSICSRVIRWWIDCVLVAGRVFFAPEYLTSATFRHAVADVTGHREFIHIDGFPSRFEAGHFLTTHTDNQPHRTPGVRKVAYSLNLTQGWDNDWGGQTCFWSDHDLPICVPPTYNTSCCSRCRDHIPSCTVPPLCARRSTRRYRMAA
ncbi:2OG-Fe(II) oxygenase [Bradyrhizobium sp. BRP22]|nr:2OG-Fe(II) oxygenase [Bradyrhizobium sp. BRP22]